ncbi:unnamed protein product [Schistosoma turkestanicum]|nr:unnamed protein product [Schistosoma turkestanicum]
MTYTTVFKLKYRKSLGSSIVKFPVLVEVVCKPYERGVSVENSCAPETFYKFRSHIHVRVDYRPYTYPCDLPQYVALRNSSVQLPNRQTNTFLNVGDILFYCGLAFSMKGSFDLESRCFKISKLPERTWSDMGPYVEQIIAYTKPLGALFGMGSNSAGVVMSKDFGTTWISINSFAFRYALNTSTEVITASTIPWMSVTGPINSTISDSLCKMRVAGQWNVCINEIYANQILLANWTDTCPNSKPF